MRRKLAVLGIVAGLLMVATPALAGGWAVITLDALPGEVRAGEILSIGFMVRQHGQTPTNAVSPTLSAYNPETGERVTVDARQNGETGHFVVGVVFPSEGRWEWSLSGFGPPISYAPLTVLPAAVASSAPSGDVFPLRAVLRWTGMALILAAGAVAFAAMRQKNAVGVPAAGD